MVHWSSALLASLTTVLVLSGCVSGQPGPDGRYPGDASECDGLPPYERQECQERYPPVHEPLDLSSPDLR